MFRIHADQIGAPLKTSYLAKVKTFAQMIFILLVLVAMIAEQGRLRNRHFRLRSSVIRIRRDVVADGICYVADVRFGHDVWI